MHLRCFHAEGVFHQGVSLADELHVAIFDAVMHHLDVVSRAVRADIRTAGHAVHLRGNLGEDGFNERVSLWRTAGHHRRSFERAFLTAGDTGADEENIAFGEFGMPTDSIHEIRVTAINNQITVGKVRH